MVHQPVEAPEGGNVKDTMTGTSIGIMLVIVCALLEGIGQVFLKKSVLTKVRWFMWISAGVTALALEALVYTEALKLLDVSVAFTIGSLNLIAITLLSQWILREHVTRTRWIGVGLIFVGAALVMART
jgi:drug/metabolite transporter (DMT)-like permease